MNAWQVFQGSSGVETQALYDQLAELGPAGLIAMNLFRACKCSLRAKKYRSAAHKRDAYSRKDWSIGNLCQILASHAAEQGIVWGWKVDPEQSFHRWVLYVEIPTGQVSFHAERRHGAQDYAGDWDGKHLSSERVIRWTATLLGEAPLNFEGVGKGSNGAVE